MNTPDAIIIGAAIVDIPLVPVDCGIFDVHSTSLERITMHVGGDAANETLVLSRLGHVPAIVSVVGWDVPGDFVVRTLTDGGVDVRGVVRRDNLDTGLNVVLVDPEGERRFITSRTGSLRRLDLMDIRAGLEALDLSGAKIACLASLFVSHCLTLEDTTTLLDELKARGLVLCADTTLPKHSETLEQMQPMLSRLDYFLPNAAEAARITGKKAPDSIADTLLAAGVGHVALKLGKEGCLLAGPNKRHRIPAFPGANCVDTTGAGDTFTAAFIAALLEGRPFLDCGIFANAAASLCVESVGAVSGGWIRAAVERRCSVIRELML